MPSLPRPSVPSDHDPAPSPAVRSRPPIAGSVSIAPPAALATAVVYCEANFGDIDGKTANGLVRHSERYGSSR